MTRTRGRAGGIVLALLAAAPGAHGGAIARRAADAATNPTPSRAGSATPGGALVRLFIAFSLAWFMVPWLGGLAGTSGRRWYGGLRLEAWAQLCSIQQRLARGEAEEMDRLFPEGKLFSYSFYGFSLVNLATANPQELAICEVAKAELERILPIVEAEVDAPAFAASRHLTPKGGIIPAAHANLLRAGYVLLGGTREDILRAFHEASALLFAEFAKSPVASLETYPHDFWPVDNVCALESLRLHDVLFGTRYARACERWAEWMAAHLDAATGMMVAQVSRDGGVVDGPRGCALSWSLALLPGFAPELARSQYERYRSTWFVHVLGITGAREWPPGRSGTMDSDTGPVLFGIGAAASGLGIAAAKANGDAANLTGMLRGVELFGLPVWNRRGKHYFLGRALLADELALWGKTIRVWDRPPRDDRPHPWPAPALWSFWLVYAPLLALSGLILYPVTRSAVRAALRARRDPDRWRRSRPIVLALQAGVIVAWLAFPGFTWLHAMLLSGCVAIAESRLLERQRPHE